MDNLEEYAIFTINLDGEILTWSPGAQGIFGYAEHEVLGRNLEILFTKEDRATGRPRRERRMALEKGRADDTRWHLRKDGSVFWASGRTFPLMDPKEGCVGFVKICRDLTRGRQLEEQDERARQRFQLLVRSVKDYAIIMLDPEGRIITWNEGARRLKGYAEDEVLGKHFDILYTAEDVAHGKPAQELDRALKVGSVEEESWRMRKDGTRYWANAVVSAIRDEAGRVLGFATVIRDLTEQQRTLHDLQLANQELEFRLRLQASIADAGQRAAQATDPAHLMDHVVQEIALFLDVELCKILELTPQGDALLLRSGVGWQPNLIGKATVPASADSQAGFTLASEHPVIVEDLRTETRFRGPALLTEHQVISGMSVIIPGTDRPYGVLGVHTTRSRVFSEHDIHYIQAMANIVSIAIVRSGWSHELKRLVEQRTHQLRETVADIEAFSYTISHDLRAPIRAIQSYAFLLRERMRERLDNESTTLLQRMADSAQRMDNLIRDLLVYSRVTRGEYILTQVNLDETLNHVLASYPNLSRAEIRIRRPLEKVLAQESLVTQIVANLLENAVKFVPKDQKPQIDVWTEPVDGGVNLNVQDNGVGIPPEYQVRIFRAFERIDPSGEVEGTGIGLAIVKKAVERLGGRAGVESRPGEGSRFWVQLQRGNHAA